MSQNTAFQPKYEDSCATVPPPYKRREPEKTALHEIVRENLEPFLQYTRENYKNPLPNALRGFYPNPLPKLRKRHDRRLLLWLEDCVSIVCWTTHGGFGDASS